MKKYQQAALGCVILLTVSVMTLLLVTSCARMGSPDGGWYDEIPPYVVAASPADRDTLVDKKHIAIRFNEYIKLENASEKVVISPPQKEQPEIKATGKYIFINLVDSLKENTTYTVDFSDAISDNNEDNPMGSYTYTFSTGNHIDTLEVSGYVLEAQTLEPVKGILVGLYPDTMRADSTCSMIRVSRTDGNGHFIIRGVAPGNYQVGALQDMDNNYRYSQASEKMAFSYDIISPACGPDTRQDTIWADQLHIKDITRTRFTHFYPDNIVLRAFTHENNDRHYLKAERKDADHFTLFFTAGHDSVPNIKGLNFNVDDNTFIVEATEKKDTVIYWLRDTALVNQDTLSLVMTTMQTDTLGQLAMTSDTLEILAKTPYAKRLKAQEEEAKEWKKNMEKRRKRVADQRKADEAARARATEEELAKMPPPPGEFTDTIQPPKMLQPKYAAPQSMSPESSVYIDFPVPIERFDTAAIHLYVEQDSMWYRSPYTVRNTGQKGNRRWELYTDWIPGAQYSFEVDTLAFQDIYGHVSAPYKTGIEIPAEDTYGTLFMNITGIDNDTADVYVSMLSGQNVVKTVKAEKGVAEFYYITSGKYYVSAYVDRNRNGQWDTGDYAKGLQPEEVYYYPEEIECKAKWDITKQWNVKARPLNQQKPAALIKQKASAQKTIKHRNAELAAQKGLTEQDIPAKYTR